MLLRFDRIRVAPGKSANRTSVRLARLPGLGNVVSIEVAVMLNLQQGISASRVYQESAALPDDLIGSVSVLSNEDDVIEQNVETY
jgi:hypothetical protein